MRICIVGKYPPIEGGVSSSTYWLAKALGEKNHKVFVVTNSWEVEEDYREKIDKNELSFFEPKNVSVYSTIKDFRSPILKSHYYTEKLINLAVDIIKSKGIDLIYTNYTLPYGIVGFITKHITKKPHILRHAGSDIGRLYQSRFLQTIFLETYKNADKIIGTKNIFKIFYNNKINTDKIIKSNPLVNTDHFRPDVKPFDLDPYIRELNVPIFSYFGKVTKLKKTYEFVNAAAGIKDKKYLLLFISGLGQRVQELKKYVASIGIKDRCIFLPFHAPWKIPSIMKASTCVVSPESKETPFLPKGTHYPKVVREAMACGRCVIIGRGVANKGIYANIAEDNDALIVNPENREEFTSKLEQIIDNPSIAVEIGKNAYKFSKKNEDFEGDIKKIENAFYSVI